MAPESPAWNMLINADGTVIEPAMSVPVQRIAPSAAMPIVAASATLTLSPIAVVSAVHEIMKSIAMGMLVGMVKDSAGITPESVSPVWMLPLNV